MSRSGWCIRDQVECRCGVRLSGCRCEDVHYFGQVASDRCTHKKQEPRKGKGARVRSKGPAC